ncbi:hypothetical protein HPP92_025155 [Vanilla planifolia]|uniref:Uncharacterized protein n=1 Tax=Vanilla planifolia TaxID=51239 RepID=A0A835PHX4_VANPL|nr:hypothetical protein HPP92_025155 [Vanilla planifolia]
MLFRNSPISLKRSSPDAYKNSKGLQRDSTAPSQGSLQKCEALAVSGLTESGDEIDVTPLTWLEAWLDNVMAGVQNWLYVTIKMVWFKDMSEDGRDIPTQGVKDGTLHFTHK